MLSSLVSYSWYLYFHGMAYRDCPPAMCLSGLICPRGPFHASECFQGKHDGLGGCSGALVLLQLNAPLRLHDVPL